LRINVLGYLHLPGIHAEAKSARLNTIKEDMIDQPRGGLAQAPGIAGGA
jgi:hypothetical protein